VLGVGVSHQLDDDISLRTGLRNYSESEVGSMPIEENDNWAVVVHSLPPRFDPRQKNGLQPVDEQKLGHEGFRRRSYCVIVSFAHFKFCR
jgi:hypothetical protein